MINDNTSFSQIAFLLAASRKNGAISPSDVADAVNDYMQTHKATTEVAGVIKIGNGIKVDDEGVASIDEDAMSEMIADILNGQTIEIGNDEISQLWD